MAWTARDEDEKKEFMDPPEELQKKVDRLAEWFRESKHTIAFTVSGWLQPGAQGRGMCAVDMCSTVFPHRELASVHLLEVSVLYQPQNTHSLPLLLLQWSYNTA